MVYGYYFTNTQKGYVDDVKNYRDITLSNVIAKI